MIAPKQCCSTSTYYNPIISWKSLRACWSTRRMTPAARSHAVVAMIMVVLGKASHFLPGVQSYGVHEDGRTGQGLPGSASDRRGLPNAPYTVDSNRLSDGVSSVHPLSTTSPSFPPYLNATDPDGDEWARMRANLTMMSRLAQGVSPKGAGSFEIAVARSNLLNSNYGTEKPSAEFTVDAWERWNPSAFAIQKGETYTVTVPGEQYWTDGRIRSDADGYTVHYDVIDDCWVAVGRCRAYLGESHPRVRGPRGRWMQLVCGVGDFVFLARESLSGHERYLPLRDADLRDSLLPIGRNLTFEANYTGELVCFANDAEGLYGNNRASLNVTVTRESWPPSSDMEETFVDFVV